MGSVEPPPIRVPVGDGSDRWVSRTALRRVLLVVHNTTSAGRLLDVLPLFHDDFRVQLLVTSTGSSAFQGGIRELFAELGLPVLPWEQALATPVDLAVSASFGGQLPLLDGKLSVLSHGVGYTKTLAEPGAGSREPGAGSREPGAGSREPGAGSRRSVCHPSGSWRTASRSWTASYCPTRSSWSGCAAHAPKRWVRPYSRAIRASTACWPPAPTVSGSAGPWACGAASGWWYSTPPGTRRGSSAAAAVRTSCPACSHGSPPSCRPTTTASRRSWHPNIWYGHGPGQVRAWLDGALRSGLTLIDPLHAWRQALLAADVVLGDFGAVTYYAAALGTPVLLAAAAQDRLDPEAPLAAFVRDAPRLDPYGPLREQVEKLTAGHRPLAGPAEFTTSAPGASAALLRRHFYTLMDLPEPERPALLEPLPLPPYDPPSRTSPLHVRTRVHGTDITIERSTEHPYGAGGTTHLAVHEDTLDPGSLELADVITRDGPPDDPRLGGPEAWTAEVLRRHPRSALAAYVTGPHTCTVRARAHGVFRLLAGPGTDLDPAAYASSLHAWLAAGGCVPEGGGVLRIHAAGGVHRVVVGPRLPGDFAAQP